MNRDAIKIKERIVEIISQDGPSLPAQIAKKIQQDILLTSVFLSELFSEKRVKMSHMKIGSSSLYFLDGQENSLEKFFGHLKSKEKEAFLLLKEKNVIKDLELEPAIRVALREIKDFAVPINKEGVLMWKFFNWSEEITIPKEEIKENKKEEEKFEEKKEETVLEKKRTKIKRTKIKKEKKGDESFFNKVKEKFSSGSDEILDIIDFKNNEISLRVKKQNEEVMVFAFNKKKVTEKDIIKIAKKASEKNLNYEIALFSGKIPKKTEEFVKAVKNLNSLIIIDEKDKSKI